MHNCFGLVHGPPGNLFSVCMGLALRAGLVVNWKPSRPCSSDYCIPFITVRYSMVLLMIPRKGSFDLYSLAKQKPFLELHY